MAAPAVPEWIAARIVRDYTAGAGLVAIAEALTTEGVPTAHGGRQWWPSTVRAVLVRQGVDRRPAMRPDLVERLDPQPEAVAS